MMRTYNPRDTKAVDELDPCVAAEIRAKNDQLFKRSHRLIIIIVALFITLLCAAAVLMIIYLATSSSSDSNNVSTNPTAESGAVKESGYLNHPKNTIRSQEADDNNYEEQLPSKALGDTNIDSEAAIPPPPSNDDSVIPMSKDSVPVKPQTSEVITEPATRVPVVVIQEKPIPVIVAVPTKPIEPFTYATKSDEIPDIVPSFSSNDGQKYSFIETDDIYEDCGQYRKAGHDQSGVYELKFNGVTFKALCLMESDYPWMVLQRRTSGSLSFDRTFEEYSNGFGSPSSDHWLGLEKVYQYVKKGYKLQLRIEIHGDHCVGCSKLGDDGYWWGDWDFAVGSKEDKYKLEISKILHGNLSDTSNDEFYRMNNGRPFTTVDQDNDKQPSLNCAVFRKYGPWWHSDCTLVALNGAYGSHSRSTSSMVWLHQQRKSGPNNALVSYSIKPQISIMMFRIKPKQKE